MNQLDLMLSLNQQQQQQQLSQSQNARKILLPTAAADEMSWKKSIILAFVSMQASCVCVLCQNCFALSVNHKLILSGHEKIERERERELNFETNGLN